MFSDYEVAFLHLGCAGFGLGALYYGSYIFRLGRKHRHKAIEYKNAPRYFDMLSLRSDLSSQQVAQGTKVLVIGTITQHAECVVASQYAEEKGVARRVVTYKCQLVRNKNNTYDEKNIKVPDEIVSVPCRLADSSAESIRMDSVHKAAKFRSFLKIVHQRRIFRSKDPPQLIGREVSNGVLIEEYMLLFGTKMATYGAVRVVTDEFSPHGDVVVTPQELNVSFGALIHGNRLSAEICRLLAIFLWISGCGLFLFGIYPLLGKLRGLRAP